MSDSQEPRRSVGSLGTLGSDWNLCLDTIKQSYGPTGSSYIRSPMGKVPASRGSLDSYDINRETINPPSSGLASLRDSLSKAGVRNIKSGMSNISGIKNG